jgi:hypothetical protein
MVLVETTQQLTVEEETKIIARLERVIAEREIVLYRWASRRAFGCQFEVYAPDEAGPSRGRAGS